MIELKPVGLESAPLVQAILDDSQTYYLNVEGVPEKNDAARHELTLLPPGYSADSKIDLLICADGIAVGFADVLRDYPEAGTSMIGLLVIAEAHQSKGYGRSAYQAIESLIQGELGGRKIRIGVNDSNPVDSFWRKMGFIPTGEVKPYDGVAKKSQITVMEKVLQSSSISREMKNELRKAAGYLLEGKLEQCHAIAQENEGPDGNYLHAVLHRKEGDLDNSLYWYRRAPNHPVIAEMARQFPGWTPEKFVALLRENPTDPGLRQQEEAELQAIAKLFS